MSSLLSDAELASMRECLQSHLPSRVAIQSNTSVSDGQGGQTTGTWATDENVDGFVEQASARGELTEGGKVVSVTLWTIELPYGTSVTSRNRLVVDSLTYEVLSVESNELGVYCQCKRLQ